MSAAAAPLLAEFTVLNSVSDYRPFPGWSRRHCPMMGDRWVSWTEGEGGERSSDEQRSDHHCDGRTALDGVEWAASAFDGVWQLLRLYCRPACPARPAGRK